jgi:hypothetical protein
VGPTKKWYQSKTIIVNVLSGAVALAAYANVIPLPAGIRMALPAFLAIANIVLRLVTGQPIEGSPADTRPSPPPGS